MKESILGNLVHQICQFIGKWFYASNVEVQQFGFPGYLGGQSGKSFKLFQSIILTEVQERINLFFSILEDSVSYS